MNLQQPCPCGSAETYQNCCQPFHLGQQQAQTAEQLMRSRYTAFCLHNSEYLLRTWHQETRPQSIDFEENLVWMRLTINGRKQGRKKDRQGWVTFVAHYRIPSGLLLEKTGHLHETSFFERDAKGNWCYVDGLIK